jgi:hypothetical protein
MFCAAIELYDFICFNELHKAYGTVLSIDKKELAEPFSMISQEIFSAHYFGILLFESVVD